MTIVIRKTSKEIKVKNGFQIENFSNSNSNVKNVKSIFNSNAQPKTKTSSKNEV